ncbi:G-type lectin S-receptor-like serine/threonine-protein kinase [Camellia lanceoleosa]|uniref:G-type lectin S-receptor-like serine/threonine-protein kinase n=1 Tax=Camellia lanceoleosa TaxID=1840588 RepID=A0ACC0J2E3_9ERIC|nr:G-type lectin S-receptor-like serine/threonine-protein kinase [Camellia lanceoleosa]
MAPHTLSPLPTTASQSGKLASNIAGRGVSSATLDDSGNFILRNSTDLVWSTFDNPTNTLLPNQNFTSSKKLESGLFSFRLLISGNLTLQWNNSIVYWNSNPSSSAFVIMAYGSDYAEEADILRFLKLDSDENLRIYSSPKGSDPTVPNPSASSLGNEKGNGWKLHASIVVVVVIVTILCLVTLEEGLWWWCCRNNPKFGDLSTQ